MKGGGCLSEVDEDDGYGGIDDVHDLMEGQQHELHGDGHALEYLHCVGDVHVKVGVARGTLRSNQHLARNTRPGFHPGIQAFHIHLHRPAFRVL